MNVADVGEGFGQFTQVRKVIILLQMHTISVSVNMTSFFSFCYVSYIRTLAQTSRVVNVLKANISLFFMV